MQELNKIIVSHSIIEKSITHQVKIALQFDAQWAKVSKHFYAHASGF